MHVRTITTLLASIAAFCLVQAQNRFTPVQMQQQRNDVFEELVARVSEVEFEVNIAVGRNPPNTNFEVREPIATSNLDRIVDDDIIIFPSYADEQQNEKRRPEFSQRDRDDGNNRVLDNESDRVIGFNREQERERNRGQGLNSNQERDSLRGQEFNRNTESRPDRNSEFNRIREFNERDRDDGNNRVLDNPSEHIIEINREQERERNRGQGLNGDTGRDSYRGQEFSRNTERRPDRNSGFNRAPEFNERDRNDDAREQESERNRGQGLNGDPERDSYRGQESNRKTERRSDRNSGFNRAPERGADRNSVFKQEVNIDRDRKRGDPQKQERKTRRLCETKYNEYIARIFRNDEDTTADANDSEFDGRELASPGEYPHMTALGFKRKDKTYDYKCGGSLISDNFVITAAHCTNVTGEVPTVARIGDLNLLVDEQHLEPQIFRIRRIYRHPQYDSVNYYNDIALLQLNTSVEFTEFVRPIRLWTRPDLPLSTAFAMGYGATSFARAPTQRLTDFNMTIIANDECNQRMPQLAEVPRGIIASQICAEDFVMHRDTCQGDSGGPLQYNIRGRRRTKRVHYHLIGITSFGLLCRSPNPGVYTRIYSFLDWIERTVWNSS